MIRVIPVVLLSFLCLTVASYTPAQAFGSFGGGPETINLANLNVHWDIPVFQKPGRGTDFVYNITYDSSVWYPSLVNGTNTWTPVGFWGFTPLSQPTVGLLTYIQTVENCTDLNGGNWTFNLYTNWTYTDANSVTHPTNLSVSDQSVAAPDCTRPRPGPYTAQTTLADGSGYTLSVTADPAATLYTPKGETLDPQSSVASPSGMFKDRNGNFMTSGTSSGVTTFTDTLGTAALTISGAIPNPVSFAYTAPSGNPASYVMKYTNLTIQTKFGCSGITEYGANGTTTANLVTEIDLPDSSKYLIAYETTPGDNHNPHFVTGRLASVQLPTGGTITYTYAGGSSGHINCDGSASGMTRQTPDGTWTYTRLFGSGVATETTVTAPQLSYDTAANQTIIQFQGIYETQRDIYQGSGPAITVLPISESTLQTSNLLRETQTCYNNSSLPCPTTAIVLPITQRNIRTILPSGQQSEHDDFWSLYGAATETDEYDFGSAPHGSLLKKTTFTYANLGGFLSAFIQVKKIMDVNGTVQYRQDISYDQTGGDNQQCPTGVPNHDDSQYGCSFTSRGNPTSVTTYQNPSAGTGGITKNFTYDSLGNLLTAQLNCCNQKTWAYSTTTKFAYPDSITRGSGTTTLTTSYTYDNNTGVIKTSVDENNKTTSYTYDPFDRPLTITRPDTSVVTYTYTSATSWKVDSPIDGTNSVNQITALDSLGRTSTVTTQDASSNTYSIVQTQYDAQGRTYQTSNPYTGSPSKWTSTKLDALGRPKTSVLQDNSQTSYSYSDPTVTVTDPSGIQRKSQYDALGRLVSVWEPDPSNNNTLTLQTTYAYSVLDSLTTVTQGSQTRTYVYDALGRVASATTPEAGRVCFGSVSGSTCNSDGYDSFDNLLKRTDARGVLTSYTYDGLNRLQTVSYNVGTSGVTATPGVTLTYGTNVSQFNNGRLISMTDGVGSQAYNYDQMGNVTQLQKIISSTTYTTGYAHNYAGQLTSITYPSGRLVTQNIDAIGRLSSVKGTLNSVNTTYASGYGYTTANQVTGFQYGNSLYASLGYSADRLQLLCLDYSTTNRGGTCAHDSTTKFGLQYSYPTAGSNNGLISGITDNADNGRSASYTYDSLHRLSTAVTTGSTNYPKWGLSWGYDRYGNRLNQTLTAGSGYQGSVAVDVTTNRITGSPYAFDANGNITNDGTNTLVYDAENRLLSASNSSTSGTYSYDGYNLRVKKVSGSTTTVYLFLGSKVIAEYVNGAAPTAPTREYVYSGGALIAKIDSTGTSYYHQDHLSNRMVTNSSGTIVAQLGHYPFGDTWYNASNDKLYFASYERDSESGNDYALARYYGSRLGRFSSPDLVAGSASNPQSFNRYGYVRNNPVNVADPSGQVPGWICLIDGGCPPLGAGGGGGGLTGGCYLEDIETSCSLVGRVLGSGGGVECPNDRCHGFNADGAPVQFVAGAGGAMGYLTAQQIAAGLNEVNGRFLTNAQYNDYIQTEYAQQIDAQRQALARAIAANSGGTISYEQAYSSLDPSPGHLQGGNYNFDAVKGLGPGSLDCGGDPRCNGVHFSGLDPATGNYYVHLDTANPFSGPLGFVEHSFVDGFLGNFVYTVIPRPWP